MSLNNNNCPKCGVSPNMDANYCPQCGMALQASSTIASDGVNPYTAPEPHQDASCLEWGAEMKLLNNRFFLRDAMKLTSLTMLVCALIFIPIFGIPGGWRGIQAAFWILLIGLVFMIMGVLIFALIMGNRVPIIFKMDAEGVNMQSVSKRVKNINRTAILLGLLARKPGTVGAGVIGQSQENTTIQWGELRKVYFYPAHRVIFLKGGIFSRIRLYCTPENYPVAERMIRKHLPIQAKVEMW